jgi:site-specific DNA-methyltransferase (adenine-specific)
MSGRLMHCDNLVGMRTLPPRSVDCIYLDPPYNTGKRWTGTAGEFSDIWRWDDATAEAYERLLRDEEFPFDVAGTLSGFRRLYGPGHRAAFAVMIGQRLVEIDRVARRPHGLVWVQCDDTASHLIGMIGDALWGIRSRRTFVWRRTKGANNSTKGIARVHDLLHCWRVDPGHRPRLVMRSPGMWDGIFIKRSEMVGYPTQKPLALLERVVRLSTSGCGTVLDPFCGSGTTLVAAQRLGRSWIGMDASADAVAAASARLGLAVAA